MISLLELEQALKYFLDLEIYIAFIKLLDQKERKTKKAQKGKKKDRENKAIITEIDKDLLVVTVVYFSLLIKKKSARKKKLYSTVNRKVSQSPKKIFFK